MAKGCRRYFKTNPKRTQGFSFTLKFINDNYKMSSPKLKAWGGLLKKRQSRKNRHQKNLTNF
jgi:hypothetical protein